MHQNQLLNSPLFSKIYLVAGKIEWMCITPVWSHCSFHSRFQIVLSLALICYLNCSCTLFPYSQLSKHKHLFRLVRCVSSHEVFLRPSSHETKYFEIQENDGQSDGRMNGGERNKNEKKETGF